MKAEQFTQWIVKQQQILLLGLLALAILIGVGSSIYFKDFKLLAAPFGFLALLLTISNYKWVYLALLASIPVSVQLELGSLSLDMPSEPLMILLTGVFIIELLAGRYAEKGRRVYLFHILIALLLAWTVFSSLISFFPARSGKFLLAKIWYVIPFIFITDTCIRSPKDLKAAFWAFFLPTVLVSLIISTKHALVGFSFEDAHLIVNPFFPNAVIYGSLLTLFVPIVWLARSWYPINSIAHYLILIGVGILLLGILLSFKRGAWLITMLLPVIFLLVKFKIFGRLVLAAPVVLAIVLSFLLYDNTFYRFAPDYEKTIWHEGDFNAHIGATFSGTEISGMERFYRWVAAKNMVAERPLVGFGPSTFNQVYKEYADDAFRTYVSDNPEQSTTHNYFLMTFTEQGMIGGGIFLFLCLFMLYKAYLLYHKLPSLEMRNIAMALLLSLTVILFHSLLNELIEVDKVGGAFWIVLVLIHKLEVWYETKTET